MTEPRYTMVITEIGPERIVLADEWGEHTYSGAVQIERQLPALGDVLLYAGGPTDARKLRLELSPNLAWAIDGPRSEHIRRNKKYEAVAFMHPGMPEVAFFPPLATSEDRRAELYGALDFLAQYGVQPGRPKAMTFDLWQSTLDGKQRRSYLNTEVIRQIPDRDLYGELHGEQRRGGLLKGGRDEARPGNYPDAKYWDLSGAYPAAMAQEPYPLAYQRTQGEPRYGTVGASRASVRVPSGLLWGPLPGRSANSYPVGIDGTGWFTLRELRQARALGCDVHIYKTLVGIDECDLFGELLARYAKAKLLEHGSTVIKHLVNRLWGEFANQTSNHQLSRYLWAVETTARVREQVCHELNRPGMSAALAATDALICTGDIGPEPQGETPGCWREKRWNGPTEVRVLKESAYSWRDPDSGEWQYSMELPESARRDAFKLGWSRRFPGRDCE